MNIRPGRYPGSLSKDPDELKTLNRVMGIRTNKEQYIIIYAALLCLVGCTNDLCSIDNIQIINNPNKSYSLVKYEKDCGATTKSSLNLALLKYSEVPTSSTFGFFIATSTNDYLNEIKGTWINDSVLLINYGKVLTIIKQDSLIGNIKVLYELRLKDSSSKNGDTVLRNAIDGAYDSTKDESELDTFYNQYISTYDHPLIIDSVFKIGNDTMHLLLKHYCLKDSAIVIPKKYVYMYKLDSFVTHNFETEITLELNNKIVLNKQVKKKDFTPYLYEELIKYAVLFKPSMKIINNHIQLDYSISIPLTDVGVGILMNINKYGIIKIKP